MISSLHAPSSVSIAKDRVVFPFWLGIAPFLLFASLIWLIVHAVRSRRGYYYIPPPPQPPTYY
jgi:hypothetical protein